MSKDEISGITRNQLGTCKCQCKCSFSQGKRNLVFLSDWPFPPRKNLCLISFGPQQKTSKLLENSLFWEKSKVYYNLFS